MPPRFAYWTIILDGAPTSFRTRDREEILPVFNQLKAKNPAALLKWFSGGRLWDSPDQAREARSLERVRRFRDERAQDTQAQRELEARELRAFRERHGRPPDGGGAPPPAPADPRTPPVEQPRRGRESGAERRNKDWRPGGEHRDPRDKYKLPPGEARKRWKERHLGARSAKPFGARPEGGRPFGNRPRGPKPFGSKPHATGPGGDRPFGDRPRPPAREGQDRPRGPGGPKRFGDGAEGRKPFERKPFGNRPGGPGKPFGGRPGQPHGRGPSGRKPGGPGGPRRKG
jgi:23S rRNA pseudouridine2605 synthase